MTIVLLSPVMVLLLSAQEASICSGTGIDHQRGLPEVREPAAPWTCLAALPALQVSDHMNGKFADPFRKRIRVKTLLDLAEWLINTMAK